MIILVILVSLVECIDHYGRVSCENDGMHLCMPRQPTEWIWENSDCRSVNSNSETCLIAPLDDCNTSIKNTTDDWSIHSNIAKIDSDEVVIGEEYKYNVECLYNRKSNISIDIQRDASGIVDIDSTSSLEIALTPCLDPFCRQQLGHPMKFPSGSETFYFQGTLNSTRHFVDFKDCWVGTDKNDADPVIILLNGCPTGVIPFEVYFDSWGITRARTPAFQFGQSVLVFLWCTMQICEKPQCAFCDAAGNPISGNGSVTVPQTDISLGPFILEYSSDLDLLDNSETVKSSNQYIVTVVLLVLLVTVILFVFMYVFTQYVLLQRGSNPSSFIYGYHHLCPKTNRKKSSVKQKSRSTVTAISPVKEKFSYANSVRSVELSPAPTDLSTQ
eukprot:GHVL01011010.1.p1 GENE.GHVL01011010.1~~GHVL01011010.1.p1  ORF type:complete len:386 (+),score=63.53 GHVL01011010.1:665-1822(+)